jgi:hypothetical protein
MGSQRLTICAHREVLAVSDDALGRQATLCTGCQHGGVLCVLRPPLPPRRCLRHRRLERPLTSGLAAACRSWAAASPVTGCNADGSGRYGGSTSVWNKTLADGSVAIGMVSCFLACVGSPCLRHCVHGDSITVLLVQVNVGNL